jgi:hypothetical protein
VLYSLKNTILLDTSIYSSIELYSICYFGVPLGGPYLLIIIVVSDILYILLSTSTTCYTLINSDNKRLYPRLIAIINT